MSKMNATKKPPDTPLLRFRLQVGCLPLLGSVAPTMVGSEPL
jgi:hypothetical protein